MITTLADALADRGYETLTAVQEAVTAPELADADLLVSAQTGSGKTVGFGLAIARTMMGDEARLGPPAAPLALVVAPTRELALQVTRELSWLYAKAGARVVSCVGGMDMRDERRALDRGAHIVVGTPGRLVDHIQRKSLDMDSLRAVVLDEADEMLDLGFREDLEFMLAAAPEDRRTLLFSATVPSTIAALAKQFQRDAVRVTTLTGATQHADITYQALQVAHHDAENAIINALRYHDAQNAIVFANTRAAVSRLTARFANRGFSVVSLSGELSQTERTHALQAMRDGRARVCVATDVAARGIDLPNLELVIHADLPSNAEGLLHRSGRTGRAGRKGISALIVTPKTTNKASRLLKFAKIQADWINAPSAEEILRKDEERLLADPVWEEESTEEQKAFAAQLLDLHTPEKIAAAYLRLYRSRQSAPEDLAAPGAPDTSKRREDRKPFGPSMWFALSVGRNDRAEARWLLPLLCRAGDMGKEAIGAIRVQDSETFVEIQTDAAKVFIDKLGDGGTLEDGVTVRKVDGIPDAATAPRAPSAPRKGGAPYKGGDRKDRSDRGDRPARPAPRKEGGQWSKPAGKPASKPDHSKGSNDAKPKRWEKADAPKADTRPKPRTDAPAHSKDSTPAKVPAKASGKGKGVWSADKADRHRDAAPGERAPDRGKGPKRDYAAKDRGDAKSSSFKPRTKGGASERGGKPGGKPGAKYAAKRPNASDPSQRVNRSGKPVGKKAGGAKTGKPKSNKGGGFDSPRRPKS